MTPKDLIEQLSDRVATIRRAANFCVGGAMDDVSPDIEVAGFGPLKLPLKPTAARRLIALCKQAPFGQGTKTLVDKKIRNAYQLDPDQFVLSNPAWEEAIRATTRTVAERLGLPADDLVPELYKLLLYRPGGHFKSHRDSEKSNGMVASLVVALPSSFEGGVLTVRHGRASKSFGFAIAAAEEQPYYAAFYADCEHEVSPVEEGFRLCLAYNLVLRVPKGRKKGAPEDSSPAKKMAQSLAQWATMASSRPLVFALDHQYTQHGLSLELLKGGDRKTADLVLAAAEEANCRAYFCQVQRHIRQFADAGDYDHGRSRRREDYGSAASRKYSLGEVYEDEMRGKEWVDVQGERQRFPEIDIDAESIVASTSVNEWKPTREEYEGYTGNEGNTLDRWYHRSVLCVWHRDNHFNVFARGDIAFAIDMLRSMVGKLKKAAKSRFEAERGECVRLAKAIAGQWPMNPRNYRSYLPRDPDRDKQLGKVIALFEEIDDPDSVKMLLRAALGNDPITELAPLIKAMFRAHGVAPFADDLVALFEKNDDGFRGSNYLWLDEFVRARLDDSGREALIAKLARIAAERFCGPTPKDDFNGANAILPEKTLPILLTALVAANDEATLAQLSRYVLNDVAQFSIVNVQVPALEKVLAWRRKGNAPIAPVLFDWLRELRERLSAATAHEPRPSTDWARAADVKCFGYRCVRCEQLNQFLADPAAQTAEIVASVGDRTHMVDMIRQHGCDIAHETKAKSNRYALVLTKTDASFQRRLRQFEMDRDALKTVNELLG